MRKMFVGTDDLVLCRSDSGDGVWSLHAPGSTDEEIASGDAPALTYGLSFETDGEWDRPNDADYKDAVKELAPWAAEIIECEGGFQIFESVQDAVTWQQQVS